MELLTSIPRSVSLALSVAAMSIAVVPVSAADEHDVRLLGRVASGNRGALAELYGRHAPTLHAYLRRLVGEPELAEELLQDTLLAVWNGADGFAGRASVRTWLIGVARRQALRRLRRRDPRMLELTDDLRLTSPSAEELALARIGHRELMAAIGQLSAIHREALGLLLVEQLSYADMADVLCVPLGTVKSRVSNARGELARELQATEDLRT